MTQAMSPPQPVPKPFPWESPPPAGPFWSALSESDPYNHIPRLFLSVFPASTIATMPLDASLPHQQKLSLLLSLAKSRLSSSQLLNHPDPAGLSDQDWRSWREMHFLLARLEAETGAAAEAEGRLEAMTTAYRSRYDRRRDDVDDKSRMDVSEDLSSIDALAHLYTRTGRYKEAEGLARRLPGLMRQSAMLGPGPSPQEMGARRMLVEVLARQGRVDEARKELEEGYTVVENMKAGKFEKYVGEEKEALDEVAERIEG